MGHFDRLQRPDRLTRVIKDVDAVMVAQRREARQKAEADAYRAFKLKASKAQSVIFSKKRSPSDVNGGKGWTTSAARSWLKGHGFKAGKVDPKPNTLRFRQFPPEQCRGGAATLTKNFPAGVQVFVCNRPG